MRALMLALMLLSTAAGALPAATYHLDAAGAGDFPTIAAAIAAAAPGDSIRLAVGLYLGAGNTQLDYGGKDIVIAGAGPGATVLDCEDSGQPAVLFQSGETRAAILRDLTFRNNKGSYTATGITILGASPTLANLQLEDFDGPWSENWPPYFRGPALHCENASPRVEDVVVRGCNYAGGVFVSGGAPELERVLIRDCTANLCGGGGIVLEFCAASLRTVTILDCNTFEGLGGGAICAGQPAATFEACRFEGNEQWSELGSYWAGGGGLACVGSSPTLRRTVFQANEAKDGGGGLHASSGAAPLLEEVLFSACGSDAGGSAIFLRDAAPILRGVTVTGCWSDHSEINDPSAIICFESSPTLERILLAFNEVVGIWADEASSPSLSCSDFFGNHGGNYGGALQDQTNLNGNISADPRFCGEGISEGVYTLTISSPCAPLNNSCGVLMGALPVACAEISGHIEDTENQPLAGVAILGSSATASTDAAGDYLVRQALGWSGTLSPFLGGYAFTPSQRNYVDLQADVGNQDYTGRRVTLIHVPADSPSIQAAIVMAVDGDSILVAPGTYGGPGFVGVSLLGKDVLIIGSGSAHTTLDCGGAGRAFQINQGESAFALVQGFRIVNGLVLGMVGQGGGIRVSGASPTLRDIVVSGCLASDRGSGISLDDSQSLLEDIVVERCGDPIDFDAYGGGIACHLGAPTLRRVLLAGNGAARDGGGLYCRASAPQLEQVTLVGNVSGAGGGGIGSDTGSAPSLAGCLVYGNSAAVGGGIFCRDASSTPDIACSDVFANPGGDYGGTLADQTGLNGNISADPLFCNAAGGDYTLDASAPCLPANNDCHMQMGAFGWGCGATAAEETIPAAFTFAAPQPNPFNPKTTLRFALPRAATVDLAIFDVGGHRVARPLAGDRLPAGNHGIEWNARDEAGRALPSGVYFARFAAGGFAAEHKLVLLR